MVKIRYARGETGWAEDLGNGQYRIDNIPLTDRLNIDDLVRCRVNDDGELVVSRRLKRRYPEKTAVRYERAEQYRLLRQKVLAAGAKIEGMVGPQRGRPGIALVAHGYGVTAGSSPPADGENPLRQACLRTSACGEAV
jgi:hypothetical protein